MSGVIPLGAFLMFHVWVNAAALAGAPAYDDAVRAIERIPALPVLEVVFVLAPLACHAGYGLALTARGRWNLARYPYSSNARYVAQRVTGLLVLVFATWHLLEYRVPKALGHLDAAAFFPVLASRLSSTSFGIPWVAGGYIVGIVAVAYHLANGLGGFALVWGLTVSRRSRRLGAFLSILVGVAVVALGLATTFSLATGVAPFGQSITTTPADRRPHVVVEMP